MRSLIDFEAAQPFATRYLTQALEHSHLVNSYIFRGRDMTTMYRMILRLAQIINCKDKPFPAAACGACQPCRWIEDNAHPGVITVTNLTFLEHIDPETGASRSKSGKPQKQIAVGQLNNLLKELGLHSGDFHRVVILSAAHEIPAEEGVQPGFTPPRDWRAAEGGQFAFAPLDRRVFPDALANKFLKTLEEPPLDTLFFLLTDQEDRLLETIISRCQVVPFTTPREFYDANLSPEAQQTFQALVQGTNRGDFMSQVQILAEYMATSGLHADEALVQFQHYVAAQLRQGPSERSRYQAIKRYLTLLDQARQKIQDKTKEEAVLEDLFLQLVSK